MVRLSDLIGKGTPDDPAKVPPPKLAMTPAAPVASPSPTFPVPARTVDGTRKDELRYLEACYDGLLVCVRKLFEQARAKTPLQLAEAALLTQQLPKIAPGQYGVVLRIAERPSTEHYLITHSVNVAFLAYHLSRCLGHDPATFQQLALSGLVIDIGMAGELERVVDEPRALNKNERALVEHHPANAVQLLRHAHELSRQALDAIASHHVRPDGQGYPKDLPPATLTQFSTILSVADVYDALTHPRSYRTPINPAQAIKLLIDGVDAQFDRRVVKALVDELSLYPRGSLVLLNTSELGVVERVNAEAPLRPVILIHRDANHNPIVPPRSMNLMEHPLVHVKDIVLEERT